MRDSASIPAKPFCIAVGKPPATLLCNFALRLVSPTTMASADFSTACAGEISPGNGTLLLRTAAGFTSTGIPAAFGVLCHLDAPCRPSIRFLSISSRISHSVACIASLAGCLRFAPAPSRGRSPFRAWPLVVVSFHFWYFHRGLEPHLQRAHAGHTQGGSCDAEEAV